MTTDLLSRAPPTDPLIAGKYIWMSQTFTYALGVEALRKERAEPFTFKENLQARVEASESGDHRLFETWLDSCTGIAYKAGTTKFKIVPQCAELCTIPAEFSEAFMSIDYGKIEGIELDSDKTAKYNTLLTKAEICKHPVWLAAVGEDKALLKTYTDIVFAVHKVYGKTAQLMRFGGQQNTPTDELRALLLFSWDLYTYTFGHNHLGSNSHFLARR